MTLEQLEKKYQDNKARLVAIDKQLTELQREKAAIEQENISLVSQNPQLRQTNVHRPLTMNQAIRDEEERKQKNRPTS